MICSQECILVFIWYFRSEEHLVRLGLPKRNGWSHLLEDNYQLKVNDLDKAHEHSNSRLFEVDVSCQTKQALVFWGYVWLPLPSVTMGWYTSRSSVEPWSHQFHLLLQTWTTETFEYIMVPTVFWKMTSCLQYRIELLAYINSVIQFTLEREVGHVCSLLDVEISSCNDGSLDIKVYHKLTYTDQYLKFSFHPISRKLS